MNDEEENMICLSKNEQGADVLVEYFSGTLDAARREELDRHAQFCSECRDLLAVWNRLDEFPAPEVSSDFDAKLYARIAAEPQVSWWRRLIPTEFSWRSAIPAGAACAALALALMIKMPDPVLAPVEPATKATVNDESVNMEQVEQLLEDLDLLAPAGPTERL
jgi:anti-sigma factor RsiW